MTNGKVLWQTRLATSVQGFPITFSVDGRQYIAVTTGLGGGSPRLVPSTLAPEIRVPTTGQAIYVFALPEKEVERWTASTTSPRWPPSDSRSLFDADRRIRAGGDVRKPRVARAAATPRLRPPRRSRPARSRSPVAAAATRLPDLPAFCRVAATLKPTADSDIKMEVWLPAPRAEGAPGIRHGTASS